MQRSGRLSLLAALGACVPAVLALAQPSFVFTSNASDLTSDGNTTVGSILDPNINFQIVTYTRGVGFAFQGTALPTYNDALKISDVAPRSITTSLYNGSFGLWFDQATFGNYGNSGHGNSIAFRFYTGTNTWTNCNGWPINTGGSGDGAAKCDEPINDPYDISSNGRFIVGGGNWGVYGAVACATRGFVYDANNGSMKLLPLIGTGCQAYCQAHAVSTTGLVVLGTDTHTEPSDPAGITGPVTPSCNALCVAVWERSVDTADFTAAGETILDAFGGGGLGSCVLNRAGTVVAATLSLDKATYPLSTPAWAGDLVIYKKTGGSWVMTHLGRVNGTTGNMVATGISDDGNTIVGESGVEFGGNIGSFIWRPTLNGGVPMDLQAYLASINGGNAYPDPAIATFQVGQGLSADGNAILGSMALADTCSNGLGLTPLPQSGVLYLNGVSCEPPRIAGGPYSYTETGYTPYGLIGNVFASGSFPMTMHWQKEIPTGSANWVNLTDSCGEFQQDNTWTYEGTSTFQLRVNMLASASDRDGNYRVVISNSCGTATSQVAALAAATGACCYVPTGGTTLVCDIELPNRCTGSLQVGYLGGIYLGNNTTCTPNVCNGQQGACCYGAGGPNAACVIDIAPHCTLDVNSGGYTGSFAGAGTTCTPAACLTQSVSCCYSPDGTSNAICTVELTSYCGLSYNLGGISGTAGVGTTCAPTACSAIVGACCFAPNTTYDPNTLVINATSDVICSLQTSAHCTNSIVKNSVPGYIPGLAGLFAGAGATCTPANLCTAVDGACCYTLDDTSNSVCTVQLQANCTATLFNLGLGGAYGGTGSTCTSFNCSTATGACCHTPFGETCPVCSITPSARCTTPIYTGGLAGIYAGNNTTCTIANCTSAQLGACCVGTICYSDCSADCTTTLGGIFQGGGTVCTASSCQPSGTCCKGSTCATGVAPTACTGANTLFIAGGTTCDATGTHKTPCCEADFNHVGGITVQDIFDFLAAWFAHSPSANITSNGSGAPTVQSIFDFLAAWFAKGC